MDPITPIPNDSHLEKAVLSAALQDPKAASLVLEQHQQPWFYTPAHQVIWRAMGKCFRDSGSVDLIEVTSLLRKDKLLEQAGGAAEVTSLLEYEPGVSRTSSYLEKLQALHRRREIYRTAMEVAGLALDTTQDDEDVINATHDALFATCEDTDGKKDQTWRQAGEQWIKNLHDRYKGIEKDTDPLPTRWKSWNELSGGIENGLTMIGAPTSAGKTIFCQNLMEDVSVVGKRSTLYFSLEMDGEQMFGRGIISSGGLSAQQAKVPSSLSVNQFPRIMELVDQWGNNRIHWKHRPYLELKQFIALVRYTKQIDPKLSLVILDHIHLLRGWGKGENRMDFLDKATREIKALSHHLKLKIVVACQVNKEGGTKHSSAMVENSDNYYLIDRGNLDDELHDRDNPRRDPCIHVCKLRNGQRGGTLPIYHEEGWFRFRED